MIGLRLGGRYEIQSRVGGGGMAIVYAGHDILLDRTVAIKVLRSQYGTDEDFIRRFRREAQAAAKLTHPNVVNIYDVGQEEDTYYIVMEYVEGETLKDLINREAPLSAEKAVNIAIQIAEALHTAHQHQIIHRDIKPQNILIGNNGNVKVTDFGIARAATSATITQTGSVLGSVHYFSPEQAKGGLTGEKSDIYSLGVVLYEMVTGELPFSGESPISVALKHLQEDFKEPRAINPNIPQSLENVVLKALSKDPDLRYQTAKEMAKDLETCLSSARMNEEKFQTVSADVGDDPTIIIPAIREGAYKRQKKMDINTEYEDGAEEYEESRKRRWIAPLIWIVVLILLAGAGYYAVKKVQSMLEVPEVEVPPLENIHIDDAIIELDRLDLVAEVIRTPHDTIEEGNIVKQEPRAGNKIKTGTKVTLTVSMGKETIPMPDVTSKRIREAEAILDGYKFKEIKITEDYNEDVPTDSVITQVPNADTAIVPSETTVTLVVSKGGETFEMPSLIGLTLDQAKAVLLKHGLELDPNPIEKESYFKKGIVLSQWPVQPNEQVSKGTAITIELSSGMKDDARITTVEMPVIVEEGKEVLVEIRISDARYTDHTVVNEIVRQTKLFYVDVVLSSSRNATITVYEDGIEMETTRKTYDELVEGE